MTKRAEIDLRENAVYVVKNGEIKKFPAIEFGQDTVIWKNGIPLDVIRSERVRV